MNPVLLKPESEHGAQVVVQGSVTGTRRARLPRAQGRADAARAGEFWAVGPGRRPDPGGRCGSPAEVNLRENDIANMGFALAADVPVALVGDVDRGGVIASLVARRHCCQQLSAPSPRASSSTSSGATPPSSTTPIRSSSGRPGGRHWVSCPGSRQPGCCRLRTVSVWTRRHRCRPTPAAMASSPDRHCPQPAAAGLPRTRARDPSRSMIELASSKRVASPELVDEKPLVRRAQYPPVHVAHQRDRHIGGQGEPMLAMSFSADDWSVLAQPPNSPARAASARP